MARAGLNRKSRFATAMLVLTAEAPDLDVIAELHGPVYGFEHHRGITHSLVGVPLVAALVVLVLWSWWRVLHRRGLKQDEVPPRWDILFALGCLSALSHILLDFTNAYGVRPFLPFSGHWYSWDIVYIFEPALWVVLIAGLVLPKLFGLVDTEVGVRRKGPRGRVGAIVALMLVVLLWGFRDYEHRRAIAAMQALTYRGQDAVRLSAYPYPLNPFSWYGVVETSSLYDRMLVNSRTPEVDPENRAQIRIKAQQTPALEAARNSYLGRVYLNWAEYPVTEVEQVSSPTPGYVVRFYDLRFLYPESRRRPLSAWVRLDPDLRVIAEDFGVRNYPGATERGSGD